MQAFAEKSDEKLVAENEGVVAPLFNSDELIFPDQNIERPYTRYGYIISKMNFLVPETMIGKVIQSPSIFSLPNSPSWIEGLINVRGNIIPVMNIDKLLKTNSSNKLDNILVINKSNDEPAIAIIIDNLPISLEVKDSETLTTDYPEELQSFIGSGFSQNKLDWVEFDPHKLFKTLSKK